MQILLAIIVVLWWISLWGLQDILVEQWTRAEKFYLYISILAFVSIIVMIFPEIVKKF
jgi:hypothetical protein